MNKKAIMVKFLVTTLLALIIFVPTCLFASQMLKVSTQAKDNFNDFVDILNEVHNKKVGYSDSFMMILDVNSAVVYFGKEPEAKIRYYDSESGGNYDLIFQRPPLCQNGTYCICLVSQPEIIEEESKGPQMFWETATIAATYMTNCEILDFDLETLGFCTVGVKGDYHDNIFCEKDVFLVERGVAEKAFSNDAPYYRNYRRTNLILINEEYKVKISS